MIRNPRASAVTLRVPRTLSGVGSGVTGAPETSASHSATRLESVWRTGALLGAKPEDAFYVKCDRSTMSLQDLADGRLIVEIGIAPTRPAEFVIFRISQLTGDARSN